MRQRAFHAVMIRVIANCTSIRFMHLPQRVEIEERDGLRDGAVRMRPAVPPGPVFVGGVEVESCAVLRGCVGRANASDSPTKWYTRPLEFHTLSFEFAEEHTRILDSVSYCNLQITDLGRGSKVLDDIHGIAILQSDKGGVQDLM